MHFYLRDYREENGRYDRIVSVGMLEHVGKRNYGRYFGKIAEILKDDGIGLVQTIGYADEPGPIDPFIRRFVFPGAAIPTLSELFQAIERSGLWVTDVEVLRLHYAETLRHWRERWAGARDRVLLPYGDKFYRMWEYYLALCEIGFRWRSNVVFQIQLAKRQTAVPITRDYIYASESRPSGEVQAEARQLATDEWTAITASNRSSEQLP